MNTSDKAYHEHCVSCNISIKARLKKYCIDHQEETTSEINSYFKDEASKQTMSTMKAFEIWYDLLDEFLTEQKY